MHQYDRKKARTYRAPSTANAKSTDTVRTDVSGGPGASFAQLQQAAGNRAVQRMLANSLHQPVQRMDLEGSEGEEEELQMKRDAAVQRMDIEGSEGEEE